MAFKEDPEMSAPPSMDLYVNDLACSTMEMSDAIFGAYFRLLMYQWQHGKIPNRPDDRQRVCGTSPERWDATWARISSRFVPLDEDGSLGHARLHREREKALVRWENNKEIAEKRSQAGKAGATKRWQLPKQTDGKCHSKCHSKGMANLEGGRGKKEGKKEEDGSRKTEVDVVVEHYQSYHRQAKPGKKERQLISARFGEGWSVEDLKLAVDGCHVSPFHCGENDRGKKYQSLELIVRDSKHVQEFIEAWDQRDEAVLSEQERRGVRARQNLLRKFGDDGAIFGAD